MVSIQDLITKAPVVKDWINNLIITNQGNGKPVVQYNFPNLGKYFDQTILSTTRVIVVDKVPQVPLASLGLPEFSAFENGSYAGVTYPNMYFVARGYDHQESLHFHELIHVIQWDQLGMDKFIKLYGAFLFQSGYKNNPLEAMAFGYQALFEQGRCPVDLVSRVRTEVDNLNRQYPI